MSPLTLVDDRPPVIIGGAVTTLLGMEFHTLTTRCQKHPAMKTKLQTGLCSLAE